MADFIIKGDCDEAIANLKKTLEAKDAAFNAKLAAMFKPAATTSVNPQQAKPEQAKPQQAKLQAKPGSVPAVPKKETTSLTRRPDGGSGGGGGSMRSRLRK